MAVSYTHLDVYKRQLLEELRTLIYTDSNPQERTTTTLITDSAGETIGTFNFKEMDIIRYSQLTLNPHRIHWDKDYCRGTEGYRDIIVQGPFSLQVLLRIFEQYLKRQCHDTNISQIKYKNTAPLYPGTMITIHLLPGSTPNQYLLSMRDPTNVYLEAYVTLLEK